MSKYILTLDIGTTSLRSSLVDKNGDIVDISVLEIDILCPESGWVEQDPVEIWQSQLSTIKNVLKKNKVLIKDIASIAITNQRETIVAWDKRTNEPIYNAIVWQDRRTSDYCELLKKEGYSELINNKTGLLVDEYFSATKIKWILDNVASANELVKSNNLMIGTIDSWIIWNLTNYKQHLTDVSNASRTMIYNINTLEWDKELLEIFKIDKSILPEVKDSLDDFGVCDSNIIFNKTNLEIPIKAVLGDQQSSMLGHCCFEKNDIKTTFGTGSFTSINIGNKPLFFNNQITTSIAWKIKDETTYCVEGSVFNAGTTLKWLKDNLKLIDSYEDCDYYAKKINKTNVYFIPAFTGLGAPIWNTKARGLIIGIERETSKGDIILSALNSVVFQVNHLIETFEKELNTKFNEMKVDGGVSKSTYMLQFLSDILETDIIKPENCEITTLGVSYLAGLAVGFWKDIKEICSLKTNNIVYKPKKNINKKELVDKWHKALNRSVDWKE